MIVSAVQAAAAAAAEQKSAESETSSLLAMDDDKGTVPVNAIISLAISPTLYSAIFLRCFDAVGWAAGRACEKTEWWGTGMVVWSEVQTCVWPS